MVPWAYGQSAGSNRKIKLVDVAIEMVDAGIPESSQLIIEEIKGQKETILIKQSGFGRSISNKTLE